MIGNMMNRGVSKKTVEKIIATYKEAWENQDPELILAIFEEGATYQEGPFAAKLSGHSAIKTYWERKVVSEQKNVRFELKRILVDGYSSVVEWTAEFDDTVKKEHVFLYEVAFLEIHNGKISSLREIWKSKRTPLP